MEEKSIINAFIIKGKRQRTLELLTNPKRRDKILDLLNHFDDFDPRVTKKIPANQQNIEDILKTLKDKGAPLHCYIISSNRDLDQKRLKLQDALKLIFASFQGSVLSCIPGKLGYYEGEMSGDRCILEK